MSRDLVLHLADRHSLAVEQLIEEGEHLALVLGQRIGCGTIIRSGQRQIELLLLGGGRGGFIKAAIDEIEQRCEDRVVAVAAFVRQRVGERGPGIVGRLCEVLGRRCPAFASSEGQDRQAERGERREH